MSVKVHPDDPKDDGSKVPAFTYAWMIPYITRAARRHGYAIGVHGSMSRDLDLIAVPWVEDANSPSELLDEICRMTGGTLIAPHNKEEETPRPHGRMAYNIIFSGAWHFIDISIMPRSVPAPPTEQVPAPIPLLPPTAQIDQPACG